MQDVVRNLRRIAARLRGEDVPGLEELDPARPDPATLSALLEHEARWAELEAAGAKSRILGRTALESGSGTVNLELRDVPAEDFLGMPATRK